MLLPGLLVKRLKLEVVLIMHDFFTFNDFLRRNILKLQLFVHSDIIITF
jgi:hypothetical protein